MMHVKRLILASMVATILSACGGEQSQPTSAYAPTETPKAEQSSNTPPIIDSSDAPASASAVATTIPAKPAPALPINASAVIMHQTENGRQMVVSADLNFETDSVRKTVSAIEELATRHAGFVVVAEIDTYTNGSQGYPKADGNILNITRYTHEGNMTVRVPRERSSDFLKDLQKYIVFLDKQIFKAEDVSLTLQKQMLEAERQQALAQQLDNLNRQQQRRSQTYQQQAEDNLRAQSEAKARENEAILQERYWRDKISLATITLRFRQPEAVIQQLVPNPDAVAKQHRPNFGTMLVSMLKQGWDGIIAIFLFLIGFWPITLGVPLVFLGIRLTRKMRSRRLSRKLAQAVEHSRRRYADEDADDFD